MRPSPDAPKGDPRIQALILAARRFTKAQVPLIGLIAGLGLRPPELFLLFSLRRASRAEPEGAATGVNPSDLAARMGVTPGHVTQVLTALERTGMVAREIDPDDRRRVLVTLTERGASALADADERMSEAYRGLAECLGWEDTERFVALLEKAAEHLSGRDGESPCPHDSFGHGRFH